MLVCFKHRWLKKIMSSKRSVMEYLLLPAGPSGERAQRFEEKCKFHSPTDMPPPPHHHEGSRSACPSTGTSPAGPIKAAGAFDGVDRDQWDRGRGLNWLCYRRGGQALETAGNGDQWLLGVITTFICIEESTQQQIHSRLVEQVCFKAFSFVRF